MNTLLEENAKVSFESGQFSVRLDNGVVFSFPIAGNRRLEGATPEQLVNVEVDERGMHWPEIDEDLSLAGLLRGDWGQFMRRETGKSNMVCEGERPKYGSGAGKPVVYLETSFVSYLTGRKTTDPRKAISRSSGRLRVSTIRRCCTMR